MLVGGWFVRVAFEIDSWGYEGEVVEPCIGQGIGWCRAGGICEVGSSCGVQGIGVGEG